MLDNQQRSFTSFSAHKLYYWYFKTKAGETSARSAYIVRSLLTKKLAEKSLLQIPSGKPRSFKGISSWKK